MTIVTRVIQLGKKLFYVGLPLLVVYGLVCLAMFLLQRQMLFIPVPAQSSRFPVIKIEAGQADYFAASAFQPETDAAVIYFGGNAEDVTGSMNSLVDCFEGCAVYAMHYRGYGASPGKPSEIQLHRDAKTLYDQVAKKHSKVIVAGRSLGSGVAVRLAAENPVDRVILLTPYDSLARVAQSKFPYLPVKLLMLDRFDSVSLAAKIDSPVLVLAAGKDEIIPSASTRRLVEAFAPGVCQFEVIERADHNSLDLPKVLVQTFMNQHGEHHSDRGSSSSV